MLLHEQGLSDNKVCKLTGKLQSCISRFLRTTSSTASTSKTARRGRSRLLTPRHERILKRLVLSGEYDTAAEIARQAAVLGLPNVLADTIRRALRRESLVTRVQPRKPALTESYRRRRLASLPRRCDCNGSAV